MEKANILKALEKCSKGFGSCDGCPYEGTDSCASVLAGDAMALLKASETSKAPKYTQILIFTKRTNLSAYFYGKAEYDRSVSAETIGRMREYYAKERDVQLIALFRWENGKCFCKIKCPINPLPVKGEFEVPTVNVLSRFLIKDGWAYKQKFYPSMFE